MLGLSAITPFLSQRIVDQGLIGGNIQLLIKLCFVSLFLYIIVSIVSLVLEKNRLDIYNGLRYQLERQAFEQLLSIRMPYFGDKNTANIHQTIKEDVYTIASIVSQDTFDVLSGFVSAIGGGISLFCIDWKLGLLTLAFMPINCIITSIMSKKNFRIAYKSIEKHRAYSEWFGDTINGIKEIRLFNIQKFKVNEMESKQKEIIEISKEQGIIQKENEQIQMLLLRLLSILIYLLSGILMTKNNITIGGIIAFQTYALMLTEPIVSGLQLIFNAASIVPSFKRYSEFINHPCEISGSITCVNEGDIDFNKVYFSYNDDNIVLSSIDLHIKKGGKYVIIGKNGVGKTTLINLILGCYQPQKGNILLNGINIKEYEIQAYRKLFSVVSQDIYLFNASIRDNICLYHQIPDNELYEIINLVHLKDLIDEKGVDYNIGENGTFLSGGQRQKIALARALVQKRPYIILDESTSNLDREMIFSISHLISNELNEQTVLCVTHSDEIENIFNNKILLNTNGIYEVESEL